MAQRRKDKEPEVTQASYDSGVIEIPEEELKALERAVFGAEVGRPDRVYTLLEWAEGHGVGETTMRKRLHRLVAERTVERVAFVEHDSAGRRQHRVGYRLVDNERD